MSKRDENCLTFKWMIENCSFLWHKKGEILESPPFIINVLEETEWCVFIYPKGYQGSSFLVFLKRKDNGKGPKEICLDFELSIIGVNLSPVKASKRNRRPFYKDSSYRGSDIPNWNEIFLWNRDSYLPNDTLTICCKIWKVDREFPIPLQWTARTKITSKHKFYITIKDFSKLEPDKNKGTSIRYGNKQNMPLNIFLTSGLNGEETMYIEIITPDDKTRFFKFKLYAMDKNGQKVECNRDDCGFYYRKNKAWLFPLTFTKRELMSKRSLYLQDDSLTLQCECSFSDGEITEEIGAANNSVIVSRSPASVHLSTSEEAETASTGASEVLKSLYTDQILCDVNLRTEKETFPAHRNILSARSPVFRTMFTSDMDEKTSGFVDIPDVDGDILRELLRYVYTNSIEGLNFESTCQLYVAADKYLIHDLRNKCSFLLRGELTRSNACEVLVLADMHQDKELKIDVQNFIAKEGTRMFNSDEWQDFLKNYIELAAETMLLKCIRE